MNKPSALFIFIALVTSFLAVYEALFPISAGTAFVRFLGLEAFIFLCVSLCIGPIATIRPKSAHLIESRQGTGLAAFFLVLAHLLLATALQYNWQIATMLSEIPILISLLAALLLTILAVTSSSHVIRYLGPQMWKRIQQLNYLAFLLSFAHFLLEAKGLFVPVNGATFVNLAEVFAILMGIATMGLQIWGFLVKRSRATAPAA